MDRAAGTHGRAAARLDRACRHNDRRQLLCDACLRTSRHCCCRSCLATDCAGLADHNATTGETVWEHPCDAYYRDLYAQLKSQKQQRAEETGAALPANLAALGLPANRYLDPLKKKAEAQQRKLKKGEDRQKLREERTQRNALKRAQREKRAAKKLQRMWRARQFRRSVNAFIQEKKAAVMVQARIRGILFRRRTREALIAQIENIAITKLQAAVRGNLSRNQLERRRAIKRKREEAAKAAREDLGAAKLVAKLVSTVSSSLKQRSRLPGMLTIFCPCARATLRSSNGLD